MKENFNINYVDLKKKKEKSISMDQWGEIDDNGSVKKIGSRKNDSE